MAQNSPPELTAPGTAEARELERTLTATHRLLGELVERSGRRLRVLRVHSPVCSVELEWADGEGVAAAPPEPAPEPGTYLRAPAVGLFYVAPNPGAEPFVRVGDVVRPGQQIGIIEAMKVMIPVEAEQGGRVLAVVAENGAPVEYGAPLFELAAAD
ncbi:acetyl-CoA carboxylase biotin carboxyl carrier protein [Amycolatopsis anabasis]|uniref:acetyl-CoA carboxylase biotin carboxyl carrier protein n=1 Tax=Amycolatopsis anabasis TaxID=1840409 RepID=UPI00131DEEA4|nr:biotin/lipoyl-containing protein [Amycolatopsis anabasis]